MNLFWKNCLDYFHLTASHHFTVNRKTNQIRLKLTKIHVLRTNWRLLKDYRYKKTRSRYDLVAAHHKQQALFFIIKPQFSLILGCSAPRVPAIVFFLTMSNHAPESNLEQPMGFKNPDWSSGYYSQEFLVMLTVRYTWNPILPWRIWVCFKHTCACSMGIITASQKKLLIS